MIKCEGIMAFHGTMVYDPPNAKFRKELSGDFVHKQFDGEGYWYNGGWSYDDRFCKDIQEGVTLGELIDELDKKIAAVKTEVAEALNQGNADKAEEILRKEFGNKAVDSLPEELEKRGWVNG